MILGQYNNWIEESNSFSGEVKAPHIVANALPSGYTDISSIENWGKYGPELIGSATGFKDWKCLQREIKTLANAIVNNDYDANWDSLNANEKVIVCNYLLSKVPGIRFAQTVDDEDERAQIAIDFDLNNRRARGNWQHGSGRIEVMRIYVFRKVSKTNALELFNDVVRDGLFELYEGGIEGSLEDGYTGINDFILSRTGTPYEANGLTTRTYQVIDGSNDSMTDIANALVDIASNGLY